MEYKRICPQCGKAFTTTDSRVRYCSEQCRKEKQRRQVKEWKAKYYRCGNILPKRKCTICGAEFQPKNRRQQTCRSPECRKVRAREQNAATHHIITCPICGKEFVRSQKHKIFCSAECRAISDKSKMLPESAYKKHCGLCGKIFIADHAGMLYCSDECRKEAGRIKSREWMRRHKEKVKARKALKLAEEAEERKRREEAEAKRIPSTPTVLLGTRYSYPPPKAYIKIRPASLPESYVPHKPYDVLVRRQA